MKKAEAISILATSVRPREAKDRARYDEAVGMAIEALQQSESCEDAIDRQAAIDALDMAIERYDEIAEKYRKKADIERNDYMDMRDNAYETQQLAQWLNELKYLREKIEQTTIKTEPKWIPVSERMPELDEDGYSEKVLVCFDRVSFCEICEYRTDKWYIGDMEDSPEDIGLRVTAWMPLPEPYKGGDSE